MDKSRHIKKESLLKALEQSLGVVKGNIQARN